MLILRNGVMDITTAGSSTIKVIDSAICMCRLIVEILPALGASESPARAAEAIVAENAAMKESRERNFKPAPPGIAQAVAGWFREDCNRWVKVRPAVCGRRVGSSESSDGGSGRADQSPPGAGMRRSAPACVPGPILSFSPPKPERGVRPG